ncbi:MAG: glycoside hydrolase family 57 protein [Sulfurimonas sp.]|uniref:glycoside hydrolase family 57 protein n=1 Tax=Sulfurimonas sp. TaxID=2022749 RepID=UPI0026070A60|nr:glycoside hydrolase family 57 protein [Sulfurimonas sp.]MDD5372298.1 glycoside hydrolase family 57 protein [Sulfurimonas sp.]
MNLSFIWHMHQPDYRDEFGIIQMPWVFLHAIKDYYDMPWMLTRHSGLKATFNITPPLIRQLKLYYENPQNNDKFLNLWLRDISSLNRTEYRWMIKICKSTPYETMVSKIAYYDELYKKDSYTNQEFFDLEILFLLSWCGVYLRTNNTVVKEMLKRESGFVYEDKLSLLRELTHFVKGIFDYYAELKNRDIISISTTPLNHPILPLLLDMNSAKIANPSTNIPKYHLSLKDDALLQITRAKELFTDTFGFLPDGFWPAEGAVDENSVALLSECGVKWIATDEEILFRSINSRDRASLYTPYEYQDMCIAFRDHHLSDLIGFTYKFWEPQRAAKDFVSHLWMISDQNEDATVFIILDGENAWEFYDNNAFDFFDELYKNLTALSWLNILHMQDVYRLPRKKLSKLHAGSWIHGEFNTWVGHKEKSRGWEMIFITKRDYEHHKDSLDDDTKAKITEHFLASECSDWFWWYGDDHFTEFGLEFDALFRSHLISIYNLMKIAPPSDLFEPIIQNRSSVDFLLKPQSYISPQINGTHGSFFEWIGSGVVHENRTSSTMDMPKSPVMKILYGQDDENIYFAFDADEQIMKSCNMLRLIIDPIGFNEEIDICDKKHYLSSHADITYEVAYEDRIEIRIDKSSIKKQKLDFRFELSSGGTVIQTLPGFGVLEIDMDSDFSDRWFV